VIQPVFSLNKQDNVATLAAFLEARRKEFSASADPSSWLWCCVT
jgi:hypothetical protein